MVKSVAKMGIIEVQSVDAFLHIAAYFVLNRPVQSVYTTGLHKYLKV